MGCSLYVKSAPTRSSNLKIYTHDTFKDSISQRDPNQAVIEILNVQAAQTPLFYIIAWFLFPKPGRW